MVVGVTAHHSYMFISTDLNSMYPHVFTIPDLKPFKVVTSAEVDGTQWYTIQVFPYSHDMIRYLLDQEDKPSRKVIYVNTLDSGGTIYDVHRSIYNLLVLKYYE